ncbi:transcription initiation factor TFIID subunit 7 isoform X2 [Leptinotarsa decemlineata]|uniref:transcription initiation factor TFIID subunit 7 isoform X2 n=1 Tax=Leptinotarsa decemlineata TaxID=7539 RepID=UPI000C2538C5|nr:transcription initiation factor TFIID subunit 7-like isoform X2 [Leptinotarsa decemlineata]
MDNDKDKFTLEEQFILRLPLEEARYIREILHSKPEKLKKLLQITYNVDDSRIILNIGRSRLYGTMKKLPTIVESYKTNVGDNKALLFKTADISHIAVCDYVEKPKDKLEMNSGICPPLKNVKKKRFRKTMCNMDLAIEAEKVSKELHYLLSTDAQAVSSTYELLYEGPLYKNQKQCEKTLFGQLSSDFSESSSDSS